MYKFCPKCGSGYSEKDLKKFYKKRDSFSCTKCDFIFYNNPKPCVAAIIRKGNKILFTKRALEPFKNWWDTPGGFIKYGESPEEALIREINEELGVKVRIKRAVGTFNELYKNLGRADQEYSVLVLVYEVSLEKDAMLAGDDVSDYKYFSIDNIPAKISFPNQKKFIKHYLRCR